MNYHQREAHYDAYAAWMGKGVVALGEGRIMRAHTCFDRALFTARSVNDYAGIAGAQAAIDDLPRERFWLFALLIAAASIGGWTIWTLGATP